MADPLREDALHSNEPLPNSILEDPSVEALLPGVPPRKELPSDSGNPRLNRTAETIGSALGATVGKLRSGMTVVQSRTEETARDVSDTISERAQSLSAAALEQAEHLGDIAEEKASELLDKAQEQWQALRETAQQGLTEARKQVAVAREERPVELILGIAALSFVAGFALHVWRSSND